MDENYVDVQKPKHLKRRITFGIVALVLIVLYIIAFSMTDLTYHGSSISSSGILKRLFWGTFFDPVTQGRIGEFTLLMFQTLAIAYAGTAIAAVVAIPFAFLAANNMLKRFSYFGKLFLDAIRAFPELVLAIIFVGSFGIGPYAGVLAIGVHSIGMLGKLYSEVIESIDMTVIEALKANGANKIQIMWFGVLPQVIPEFSSFAIYRYEIDVRASTILGVVGAGGIGTPLILASMQRNWEQVGMMLILIIIFVSIIDFISAQIRKRLV
ncbi:phosphonate ABC transporter, permease protein PhnE [Sporolactobacillus sp. Y61]|uniref:Phosphonate ABC transporter, permease protein PhnE n=1 Tax=Sporolactobacillus sp. Y61 TaxID=3160863 RepID=A0AAU8IGI2_9BACL|nr:phosphonate ABC transporter, permease protein PhnE [Sporolactobacillus sp. THM19-2]RYL92661.1 phosphonate ABC transporter, permease protein PhnE [Sporolactobacillus sp. THM19-2]